MTHIGKTIKQLRAERSLTQNTLGKMVGVSEKTVSKWENGDSMPTLECLPKIADAFRVSTDLLLGHKGIEYENINAALCEYTDSLPGDRAFGKTHDAVSYLICGLELREMRESGNYDINSMNGIENDLKTLIELRDERIQHYYRHENGKAEIAWSRCRSDGTVAVLHSDTDSGFETMLSDFGEAKELFALLSAENAEGFLKFLLADGQDKCFTAEHATEASGCPKETADAFISFLFGLKKNTNECIIEKSVAVIGGEEKTVYNYYTGAFEAILRSVIYCACVLTGERYGFR